MSDLISRQAAIDAVMELTKWYYETYRETRPTGDAVLEKLMDLPSAQPKIIYCKDCKHLKRSETSSKLMMCQRRGRLMNLVDEFDFCSKAERRTDETD